MIQKEESICTNIDEHFLKSIFDPLACVDVHTSTNTNGMCLRLKEMGLEAIINAGRRKARLENRWFYWKYKDEVDEIRRKSSDWMGDKNDAAGGGTGGFAIGRRIYEKQEIDIEEKLGASRESKLMDQKYNLRYAKEDFQLWDHVHGKDVIKQLEMNSVIIIDTHFRGECCISISVCR